MLVTLHVVSIINVFCKLFCSCVETVSFSSCVAQGFPLRAGASLTLHTQTETKTPTSDTKGIQTETQTQLTQTDGVPPPPPIEKKETKETKDAKKPNVLTKNQNKDV